MNDQVKVKVLTKTFSLTNILPYSTILPYLMILFYSKEDFSDHNQEAHVQMVIKEP